jgi:NAD+ synthase/NAD+ synthase (glutamine-hydrolysing)
MRVALAQINPTVGDLRANAELIRSFAHRAARQHADLVVFPELAVCGYPPRDLLLHEGFVLECEAAASDIARAFASEHPPTAARPAPTLVLGCPLFVDAHAGLGAGIANGLLVFRDGERVATYHKRLLPTYDVFDEDRYFTPGAAPGVVEVRGRRIGLAICEDLWKGEDAGFASRYLHAPDPVRALVEAGAECIVAPSASPFVLGKGRKHRDILRAHARRHSIPVAGVNQVGANDDLVFDGHASVFDGAGRLVAAAPGFEEHLLIYDLPSQDDLAATPAAHAAAAAEIPDALIESSDEALAWRALVLGVRDYCRKTGFRTAVLGLSGGIDSALTAAIAVAALGPANVLGVAMPGEYSSQGSKFDAYDSAQRLGMQCPTLSIDAPLAGFRRVLDPAFSAMERPKLGAVMPDLTEENLQSRVRGTLLMAISNRTGAIVLTTGNKSELAVGYCTLYGDMNGGLAVLSDVSKTLVYRLARYANEHFRALGFAHAPIPQSSIDKAPSAELRPNQTDQDSLPPYDVLDAIIERYVERRERPSTIARAGFDENTVLHVCRMIDLAEYKRKQAAIGIKITTVAFGSGRRVPIAQRWRPNGKD